ncbi:cupin-like domain-containing protein [Nocardia sp. NPDC050175]|uniref:cupin-like domain-containing protein n=1 Tax=Nocardia sp. NPDC050175 TaxID=3364317 RepID=UPI0037AF5F13
MTSSTNAHNSAFTIDKISPSAFYQRRRRVPPLPRAARLSPEAFVDHYVIPRTPVIVTDEVTRWPAFHRWTWDYLINLLGDQIVDVYGDWFTSAFTTTFAAFAAANVLAAPITDYRYVRWFSRNRPGTGPWADAAFAALSDDWHAPLLFPSTGYAVPPVMPPRTIDPTIDPLPYRGLFVSGVGARTRLHVDPWMSSALLCNVVGTKYLTMWSPESHDTLLRFSERGASGELSGVAPTFTDTLHPGEMLFIPAGWWHEVDTASSSVSITWNFVHQSHGELLRDYIVKFPNDPEIDVLDYFLDGSHAHDIHAQRAATSSCAPADYMTTGGIWPKP